MLDNLNLDLDSEFESRIQNIMGGNLNSMRRPSLGNQNYHDYYSYNNTNGEQSQRSPYSPVNFNSRQVIARPKMYSEKEILAFRDPTLISWPHIFLGSNFGNKNPQVLRQLGITHVLNMAYEIKGNPELVNDKNIKYKKISADDSHRYNIRQDFEEAFAFMDDAVASNGKVYVHCMMGISRSSTIVIGFLMSRYNMSFTAAYNLAKSRRPEVNPNSTFVRILEEYGQELQQRKGNLVSNNSKPNFASNLNLGNSQENLNFNSLDDGHIPSRFNQLYGNNNNMDPYFYDSPQMKAAQLPQQQRFNSYGYGNNRLSQSNMNLFGFSNNDSFNNLNGGFNPNNNEGNFGFNLNRNRYMSNPNLSNLGGGFDNFQYF